jgi:hypothetical protein
MSAFVHGFGPILAVLAAAAASVLKKWIEETSRTRRLIKSIEGAEPPQRSEIIRACSQLEYRPIRQPDPAETDAGAATRERSLPLDDHGIKRAGR